MGNRPSNYSQPLNIKAMKDDYKKNLTISDSNTLTEAKRQLNTNLSLITKLHNQHLKYLQRVYPSNVAESPFIIAHVTKERDIVRNRVINQFLDTAFSDKLYRSTIRDVTTINELTDDVKPLFLSRKQQFLNQIAAGKREGNDVVEEKNTMDGITRGTNSMDIDSEPKTGRGDEYGSAAVGGAVGAAARTTAAAGATGAASVTARRVPYGSAAVGGAASVTARRVPPQPGYGSAVASVTAHVGKYIDVRNYSQGSSRSSEGLPVPDIRVITSIQPADPVADSPPLFRVSVRRYPVYTTEVNQEFVYSEQEIAYRIKEALNTIVARERPGKEINKSKKRIRLSQGTSSAGMQILNKFKHRAYQRKRRETEEEEAVRRVREYELKEAQEAQEKEDAVRKVEEYKRARALQIAQLVQQRTEQRNASERTAMQREPLAPPPTPPAAPAAPAAPRRSAFAPPSGLGSLSRPATRQELILSEKAPVTRGTLEDRGRTNRRKWLFDFNDVVVSPTRVKYVIIRRDGDRRLGLGNNATYQVMGIRRGKVITLTGGRTIREAQLRAWALNEPNPTEARFLPSGTLPGASSSASGAASTASGAASTASGAAARDAYVVGAVFIKGDNRLVIEEINDVDGRQVFTVRTSTSMNIKLTRQEIRSQGWRKAGRRLITNRYTTMPNSNAVNPIRTEDAKDDDGNPIRVGVFLQEGTSFKAGPEEVTGCSICFEPLSDPSVDPIGGWRGNKQVQGGYPVKLNCGHIFHAGCWKAAQDISRGSMRNKCPMCRVSATSRGSDDIFRLKPVCQPCLRF